MPLLLRLSFFLRYNARGTTSIHMPSTVINLSVCLLLVSIFYLFDFFFNTLIIIVLFIYPSLCLSASHLPVCLPLSDYLLDWLLPPCVLSIFSLLNSFYKFRFTWLPLSKPLLVFDLILHLQQISFISKCVYLMLHSPPLLFYLIVLSFHVNQFLSQTLTLFMPAHFVRSDPIQLVSQILLVFLFFWDNGLQKLLRLLKLSADVSFISVKAIAWLNKLFGQSPDLVLQKLVWSMQLGLFKNVSLRLRMKFCISIFKNLKQSFICMRACLSKLKPQHFVLLI